MKSTIPHPASKRTALTLLTSAALAAASQAAVLSNGDFESGLTGWTESGGSGLFSTVSELDGEYLDILPVSGSKFGIISNNGTNTVSVSQTFDITNNFLQVSFRFLTDEYNTGPDYNDFATISLTVGGIPTTLATISRNDLQAGGIGSTLGGAALHDNTETGFDLGQSGWQTLLVDVSPYFGQSGTLSFAVNNVGGSDPDIGVSLLAVDRVNVVPEPSSSLLLLGAAGFAGLHRRRPARAIS
jgi:hypothetical protein